MTDNIKGTVFKNYSNCPFTLTLPVLGAEENTLKIHFSIKKKAGVHLGIAVDTVFFNDPLNREIEYRPESEYCPENWIKKSVNISIPVKTRFAVLRGSTLQLCLLCNDKKRYVVSFSVGSDGHKSLQFEQIKICEMSKRDNIRMDLIFRPAEKQIVGEDKKSNDVSDLKSEVFSTPKLEDYKEALRNELYYLKNNGGRKYKISNGIRLVATNGAFTYSFELESELYIADDSPIVITLSEDIVSGTVMTCENYQIIVLLNKDIGPKVSSAMLAVEPWKLLEAQLTMINKLSSEDVLAKKLIEEGPILATGAGIDSIHKGQKTALKYAKEEDITVIWGPPGTGKTYTMARIAIDSMRNGESVLIVSHSNVSVDGVILSIASQLRDLHLEQYIESGKVLRYGYVRDERLNTEKKLTAFNYALSGNKSIKKKIDDLQERKESRKRTGSTYSVEDLKIEKELKSLRASLKEEEKVCAGSAEILATTISKVTIDKLFENRKYDVVMFDEVSMAYITQIVCAAMYAKRRFVCVGDFRQLAPIVQAKKSEILKKDIFEFLGISSIDHKVHYHPWLVMLNVQRRMYPDISAFASTYVYSNQLKNHEDVKVQRQPIVDASPLSKHAMNLIDLSGTYCAAAKDVNNSRFNVLSALISFATARTVEKNGEAEIGIITPYAAQTRIIRAMVKDLQTKTATNIACSTVHQFQGSERNVVVFDAVEDYPFSKAGWLMSKNENNSVTRLINVALTRSRGKFITIADTRFWKKKFDGTENIFYKLMRYIETHGNAVNIKDKKIQRYFASLDYGKNIKYFEETDKATIILKEDIKKAKDRIVISMPDGMLENNSQKLIYDLIVEAKKRGIHIYCKSNGYAELPEKWKSLSWGTENAIIPAIKIDDKVIWYGLPLSRGQFKDGDVGFLTVISTIFRISGKYTVDIISSITNLESTEVKGTKTPLKERSKTDVLSKGKADDIEVKDGKAIGGLAGYVLKTEVCEKCRKPLKLLKGKRGVPYMKCTDPNCSGIEYLRKDVIDSYIADEHITCPIHHCGIYGGLGKYGPYIRCNMGHYLKVDEI